MKTQLRKRVQLTDFPESITDQDSGKELTMKSIVSKLEKGIMPRMTQEGVYLQQPTSAVNYQDVHALRQKSLEFYNDLPTNIKKAMGNDFSNLEKFIHDPKNKEILLQEGLLVERKEDTNLVKLVEKQTQILEKLSNPINPTDPSKKTV